MNNSIEDFVKEKKTYYESQIHGLKNQNTELVNQIQALKVSMAEQKEQSIETVKEQFETKIQEVDQRERSLVSKERGHQG